MRPATKSSPGSAISRSANQRAAGDAAGGEGGDEVEGARGLIGGSSMRLWTISVAMLCACPPILAAPIAPEDIAVLDGDTIRIRTSAPSIRLVGFNAPETKRGKFACEAERQLGIRASARLRELVKGGNLDFEFVACSCPAGTEGRRSCNYGRKCGTLKSNGRDVGEILIEEKLAVPFVCGPISCPTTPRPWC